MEKSSRAMEDADASLSSAPVMRRRSSYGALGSLSPGSGVVTFSLEPLYEQEHPHFLNACHLCRRPLSRCRDIFMYRGNMPFCSEECRQEQIELDEAREEEEASYWKSQRRGYGHRVSEPDVAASAEAQGIRPRAAHTVVAG